MHTAKLSPKFEPIENRYIYGYQATALDGCTIEYYRVYADDWSVYVFTTDTQGKRYLEGHSKLRAGSAYKEAHRLLRLHNHVS